MYVIAKCRAHTGRRCSRVGACLKLTSVTGCRSCSCFVSQWTSLEWGFRLVMAVSGVAMLCMLVGWRVAAGEYRRMQLLKVAEDVEQAMTGGPAPKEAEPPSRRFSIAASVLNAGDVPYEMARTRGWTLTAIDGLFASIEEEELVDEEQVARTLLQQPGVAAVASMVPPVPQSDVARQVAKASAGSVDAGATGASSETAGGAGGEDTTAAGDAGFDTVAGVPVGRSLASQYD